jgi:cyclopropane-fatty-acyl-phospholipid synthase
MQAERYQRLIEQQRTSPVAIHTDAANVRHYELVAHYRFVRPD